MNSFFFFSGSFVMMCTMVGQVDSSQWEVAWKSPEGVDGEEEAWGMGRKKGPSR